MRTVQQKTTSQIALKDCSQEIDGGGQYVSDFGEGGTYDQTYIFAEEC